MTQNLPDIKPNTPVKSLDRGKYKEVEIKTSIQDVAPLVGMSETFVRKVCGHKKNLSASDVITLLDQDAYHETFIPRSMILDYIYSNQMHTCTGKEPSFRKNFLLKNSHALDYIKSLPNEYIQSVITSTPYWGLRIYKDTFLSKWADGEECAYGHEQTPEAFIRHTIEILHSLKRVLNKKGSIWWNIMDSFNTRTQIRGNAVEALRAMQGKDPRSWKDHDCRRYSAGHSYLKDGEQCMIPAKIADRASRIGFYVKSIITWAKTATIPEPQNSRVSRNLEYIIHLSKVRAPYFDKTIYRTLPSELGGRNNGWETDKLSDVWTLPTSSGREGHGAQFPVALPGRCIALTSSANDIVLDPFVGAGNAGAAALALGRRFIGIDVSEDYLNIAKGRMAKISAKQKNNQGISAEELK